MALGAITVVKESSADGGSFRMDLIKFAGDSAYPAGGTPGLEGLFREKMDAGNFDIKGVIPQDCGGYTVGYDPETDKLKVYHADYAAGVAGKLVEVPATTDLSATTFRLLVMTM